jgi:hypothetical protein
MVQSRNTAHSLQRHSLWLILGLSVLMFGILAIFRQQDTNWDLRNYHFYTAYAFFNQRLSFDFVPAQLQSFHNPGASIPIYWLINHLPPRLTGFIIGGIQGINFFLTYLIVQLTLKPSLPTLQKLFLGLLITVASIFSPVFLFELGATYGDNTLSIFVLTGLFLILKVGQAGISELKFARIVLVLAIAGLCFGIAGGLKLTNLTYALAALAALVLTQQRLWRLIAPIAVTLGIVTGFLLTNGYWMFFLNQQYANPLFPYYNGLFKSPYFALINLKDQRWIPKSIWHGLSYPFAWVIGRHPSSENAFRDLRWAIVLTLFVIAIVITSINFLRQIQKSGTVGFWGYTSFNLVPKYLLLTEPFPCIFIISFTYFGFLIWLYQFGYTRYLMPLDLISGLFIVCLIERVSNEWFAFYSPSSSRRPVFPSNATRRISSTFSRRNVCIVLLVLILVVGKSPAGDRIKWDDSWFGVKVPPLEQPDKTMILMLSGEPMSYVIPYFPKPVRFVRIEGNLFADPALLKDTLLERSLLSTVAEHDGLFYALYPQNYRASNDSLQRLALQLDPQQCSVVSTRREAFQLCQVSRLPKKAIAAEQAEIYNQL